MDTFTQIFIDFPKEWATIPQLYFCKNGFEVFAYTHYLHKVEEVLGRSNLGEIIHELSKELHYENYRKILEALEKLLENRIDYSLIDTFRKFQYNSMYDRKLHSNFGFIEVFMKNSAKRIDYEELPGVTIFTMYSEPSKESVLVKYHGFDYKVLTLRDCALDHYEYIVYFAIYFSKPHTKYLHFIIPTFVKHTQSSIWIIPTYDLNFIKEVVNYIFEILPLR